MKAKVIYIFMKNVYFPRELLLFQYDLSCSKIEMGSKTLAQSLQI